MQASVTHAAPIVLVVAMRISWMVGDAVDIVEVGMEIEVLHIVDESETSWLCRG